MYLLHISNWYLELAVFPCFTRNRKKSPVSESYIRVPRLVGNITRHKRISKLQRQQLHGHIKGWKGGRSSRLQVTQLVVKYHHGKMVENEPQLIYQPRDIDQAYCMTRISFLIDALTVDITNHPPLNWA